MARCRAGGVFLAPNGHRKRADDHETQTEEGFFAEFFVEKDVGKSDGDDQTEFVDGDNHTDDAILNGVVVTQPGCAGRQTGKQDKNELVPVNFADFVLFAFEKDDKPCHDEYDAGADGCAQIGLDTRDTDLGQNGGERGKDSRADGVQHPAVVRRLDSGRLLFLDHQENSCRNQKYSHHFPQTDPFPKKKQSQKDGQYST